MEESTKVRVTKHCIPGVILIPKDGYWQIRQVGLTADRVKKDPAFKRTRQHARELAQISKAGKLIGDALLPGTGIRKAMPRLISLLMNAIQTDAVNIRGNRNLLEGNWQSLEGFEFNEAITLQNTLAVLPMVVHKPDHQEVTIEMPSFIPTRLIHAPPDINYCRIVAIAASLDFSAHLAEVQKKRTTLIPIKQMRIPAQALHIGLGNAKDNLHLVAIGLEWYGPSNGNTKIGRSIAPLPLAIVSVGRT